MKQIVENIPQTVEGKLKSGYYYNRMNPNYEKKTAGTSSRYYPSQYTKFNGYQPPDSARKLAHNLKVNNRVGNNTPYDQKGSRIHMTIPTSMHNYHNFLRQQQRNQLQFQQHGTQLPNHRHWIKVFESPILKKHPFKINLSIKPKREDETKVIPEDLFSSIKYELIHRIDLDPNHIPPSEDFFLLARIKCVYADSGEEIFKRNRDYPVLEGKTELLINPYEKPLEQRQQFSFNDVSFHHRKRDFSLQVTFYHHEKKVLVYKTPGFQSRARKSAKNHMTKFKQQLELLFEKHYHSLKPAQQKQAYQLVMGAFQTLKSVH